MNSCKFRIKSVATFDARRESLAPFKAFKRESMDTSITALQCCFNCNTSVGARNSCPRTSGLPNVCLQQRTSWKCDARTQVSDQERRDFWCSVSLWRPSILSNGKAWITSITALERCFNCNTSFGASNPCFCSSSLKKNCLQQRASWRNKVVHVPKFRIKSVATFDARREPLTPVMWESNSASFGHAALELWIPA